MMKTIGLWLFAAALLAPLHGRGELYDGVYYWFGSSSDNPIEDYLASGYDVAYVRRAQSEALSGNILIRHQVELTRRTWNDDSHEYDWEFCTLPVTSIGDNAFYGCSSLTSVTIPSSVTSIGDGAFSGCSSLPSVTIPSSVTSIGSSAFYNCSSLTSVTIGNGVTSIGEDVFAYCSRLTSVTIGNGVTSIGGSAFYNCSSLTSVMIPSSVTSIGVNAFSDCSSLTSVTIPDSVTSIGYRAFAYCSSLTSVTIPSSVTSIDSYAFNYCSSLASVTVSQYVMGRGLQDVFSYKYDIRNLVLDETVTSIHENCFSRCESLTTIEVAADNPAYFVSPMDGCLYDREQTTLLCCPRDKTSIVLPYGVTKIGNYAFAYCTNLVSVALPVTLKEIGQSAFYDCANLPTVVIPDGVTKIDNNAFGNCRKLHGVTIPSGVEALSTSAFNNCDILWTEWYRTLADFAVNGRAYDLTQKAGDRAIANVSVSGDTALDAFVLKEGKVYDSVLYISNTADHAVKVTLPSMSLTEYKTFKGASPLTLPAYSTSILTITRVAAGNAGGNVFLVSREELETVR